MSVVVLTEGARAQPEDPIGNEEERVVRCRVLYRAGGGVYVDAGEPERLLEGTPGRLLMKSGDAITVEVGEVAPSSSYLRVRSESELVMIEPGEDVTLVLERLADVNSDAREPSASLRDREAEGDEFVPLLAPRGEKVIAHSEPLDKFHGRLWVRQLFQVSSEDHDAARTRVGTSGRLERIGGGPWAIEWWGELSYAAGDAYVKTGYLEEVRYEARELAVFRRFEDRSFLRFGRFLPLELPSVGYIDGAHAEKVISERFRLGGIAGFKPTRDDLEPSFEELVFVLYGTFDVGTPDDVHWTGTAGLLSSLWKGTPDRVALLADQRLTFGKLSVFSSTEIDLDTGAAVEREGVRLTREDLLVSYQAVESLELRAGFDRYELPDNEGERSIIDPLSLRIQEFFADAFSRYWVGASQRLPLSLRIDAEIAYTESDFDDGIRGTASITRVGLPGMPHGSVTISAYRHEGAHSEGYGARISAFLPVLDGRLAFHPSAGYRYSDFETTGENFFLPVDVDLEVLDVSLRAHWTISRAWQLTAGAGFTHTDEEQAILAELGATFRW